MSENVGVAADWMCDECNKRARRSKLVPGTFLPAHKSDCSQNSANRVCDRCGKRHADLDFGQILACTLDVPIEEGRDLQHRIVDRLAHDFGIEP